MKKIKALSFPENVAMPETYRIGIAFGTRHREIEDCVSGMGWDVPFLDNQKRAGRDGEINVRRLKGEMGELLSRKYSDGDRFP